jgi:hypothetical protein
MELSKLRGKIEKKIVKEDANPQIVASLLAGIVTGLRECARNAPDGDWQQDEECIAFAEELESLKRRFHAVKWRNRSGLKG